MKRLLYIPIIHDEADLGSARAGLVQRSAALSGEQRWVLHRETVGKFWERVAAYLHSFDPHQLRVYQDGLAADGETGRHIVEEATRRGSRNYQLVLELLKGGAELRKTEDPTLLLREREVILGHLQQDLDVDQYRTQSDWLMEERDKFIAKTVRATLKEREVGVLFIGAYHNVASHLARDISVEVAKDPGRVRAYFEELFLGHDEVRLEELVQYLTSGICGGNLAPV